MTKIIERLFPANQSVGAIIGTAWLEVLALLLLCCGVFLCVFFLKWKNKNRDGEDNPENSEKEDGANPDSGQMEQAENQSDNTKHVLLRDASGTEWEDANVYYNNTAETSFCYTIALSLGGSHAILSIMQVLIWQAANHPPSRYLALVHGIHAIIFGVVALVLFIRLGRLAIASSSLRNVYCWLLSESKGAAEAAEVFGAAVFVICEIIDDVPTWIAPYMSADGNVDTDKGRAAVAAALGALFHPESGASIYFRFSASEQKTVALLSSLVEKSQPTDVPCTEKQNITAN